MERVHFKKDWSDGNGNSYRSGQTAYVDKATADKLVAAGIAWRGPTSEEDGASN
jgi:hypothetical protein